MRFPDSDPGPITDSVLEGANTALGRRFSIEREIGRGGMAVVYLAHDRHLDRRVAIKVLSTELASAVDARRFRREIGLTARLVHPGIVALYDSGDVDGRPFYVMPYIAGETLRARLTRERRLSVRDALLLGAEIADALAYAHSQEVVHRDVKPENIFCYGGRALIADFGIAELVGARPRSDVGSHTLTRPGTIVGTTTYMSPEQANSEGRVDGRSDLYSLGCVLYEALAGEPPFVARSPAILLAQHLAKPPRSIRARRPEISPAVEALIARLLAKRPSQRPASASILARCIRRLIESSDEAPTDASHAIPVAVSRFSVRASDSTAVELGRGIEEHLKATLAETPGVRMVQDPLRSASDGAPAATLEGIVRRSGEHVRVTLSLLAHDRSQLWRAELDGSTSDALALEDEASDAVIVALERRLTGGSTLPPNDTRVVTRAVTAVGGYCHEGRRAWRLAAALGPSAAAHREMARMRHERVLGDDPLHARALVATASIERSAP
jgi:eukaryotic-like serine/threonine-protein kinase